MNIVAQSLLPEESLEQVDFKIIKLKKMQYQLKQRDGTLTTFFHKETKETAEPAQLRTQSSNTTSETTEFESVALESVRPTKRAKVVFGSGSGGSASSTAAYSALLHECSEFKNSRDALLLKN